MAGYSNAGVEQPLNMIPPHPQSPTYSTQSSLADPGFGQLRGHEIFWRDRYHFLEERGYKLRTRYHPDWIPSWRQPRPPSAPPVTSFMTVEDSRILPPRVVPMIDATRIVDGKRVYLKRVKSDSSEVHLMMHLSSPPLSADPRNHSVPLLDSFPDPDDSQWSLIIMPFLRYIDSPPFSIVNEFLDFCDQMLEGLAFLHEHQIAHMDCTYQNMAMDANNMYPNGFHPIAPTYVEDMTRPAYPLPRSLVQVKYYFIDFGLSLHIPPNENPEQIWGISGIDLEAPELRTGNTKPYNPFKLDIFTFGNFLRKMYIIPYSNLDFLAPLADQMTSQNPSLRPSATEVLDEWGNIKRSLSIVSKSWRLRPRNATIPEQLFGDVYGFVKLGLNHTSLRRYLF